MWPLLPPTPTAALSTLIFVIAANLEIQFNKHYQEKVGEYRRSIQQSLVVALSSLFCFSLLCPEVPLSQWLAIHPLPLAKTLLINTLLFLGPHVVNHFHREPFYLKVYPSPYSLKAYLLAPLIEELHFRLLFLLVLDPTQSHRSSYLWTSSCLFSVAHCHREIKRHWLPIVFQMAFTWVFGWYAGVVFYETRSVVASSLLHSYCNVMGPPNMGSLYDLPDRQRQIGKGVYLLGIGMFWLSMEYLL